MFSKLFDNISHKSHTPKSTPPSSAPASRPSSRGPSRVASSTNVSETSVPHSPASQHSPSRRASLAEDHNNFTGTNPAFVGPSGCNNFTGASPPAATPRNNFTGMGKKGGAARNNFFGVDTMLTNDFGIMNPQHTRNNFPGDS